MICDSEYRADDHSGVGVARGQLFIRLTGDAWEIDIKPVPPVGRSVSQSIRRASLVVQLYGLAGCEHLPEHRGPCRSTSIDDAL